ncbi:MAG: hypothetical protein VX640_03850 [Pseudomonadota bacterium]|nr:hypothetical protein [Pseudomonadota bacterium]
MGFAKLLWVGLFCCIGALLVKLFPNAAFSLGVDVASAWLLFGFGVFLILAALLAATKGDARRE